MKIGFIGYGNMAAALAQRWSVHHELFIGGRDPVKRAALAGQLGPTVGHGSEAEAVGFADVVVLATQHDSVISAMEVAGGPSAFAGKIIIDINNPVSAFDGNFLPKTYDGASLAEAIATYAPEARVVKAFNMCQAQVWQMEPPVFDGRALAVLTCSDDEAATATAAKLIAGIGAEAVDLGGLRYARLLEAAAAIVIKFLFSGRDWRTVLNLIQPESKPVR